MEEMTEEMQMEIYSQYIFLHKNYYALLNMRIERYEQRFIKEIRTIEKWAKDHKYSLLEEDAHNLLRKISEKIEKKHMKSIQKDDEDIVLIKGNKTILIEAKNGHRRTY